jgi:hypothetical protein
MEELATMRALLRHAVATLAYRGSKSIRGARPEFAAFRASDAPLAQPVEKIFQGPVADALTHVGQLNALRRMAQDPVKGENYFLANIEPGRVGPDQAPPVREFD